MPIGAVEHLITRVSLQGVADVTGKQLAVSRGFRAMSGDIRGATGSMEGFSRSSAMMTAAGAGMAAAGVGILRWIWRSVPASIEAEEATMRLRTALMKTGEAAKVGALRDYASALQSVTTADDEAIVAGMALVKNMGVQTKDLNGVAKAALALSAITKGEVGESFTALGRLIATGMGRGVKAYIPGLKEAKTAEERLALVMKFGIENFYKAEEATKTGAGAMKQLENAIDDLRETFGGGILNVMKFTNRSIIPLVEKLTKLNEQTHGAVGVMTTLGAGFMVLGGIIIVARASIGALAKAWLDVAAAATGATAAQRAAAGAGVGAGAAGAAGAAAGAAGGVGAGAAAAGGAAAGAGLRARAVGFGARALRAGTIALIGSLIGDWITGMGKSAADEIKEKGPTAGRAAKAAAGTVLGGAVKYGAIGAAVGSLVPFIGTAVGGAIGAAGGAIYGGISGRGAMGAEAKPIPSKATPTKDPATAASAAHLKAIKELLDKQNRIIIGGGERARQAYNQGDLQRALFSTFNAAVV